MTGAVETETAEWLLKDLILYVGLAIFWFWQLYAVLIYGIVTWKGDRIHFIEIHEEDWCPVFLRQQIQKSLQCGWQFFGLDSIFGSPADTIADIMIEKFGHFDFDSILDLCSGSCGPSSFINKRINEKFNNKKKIVTILTDLYPHSANWQQLAKESNNTLTYCNESVDATNVPLNKINDIFKKYGKSHGKNSKNRKNEIKIRTLFGSFHHFHKNLAINILKDAMINGDAFIVGELVLNRRSLFEFMQWPVLLAITTPLLVFDLIRHYWQQNRNIFAIILTIFLIPVTYSLFCHDAIISCSRIYLEEDLIQLSKDAKKEAKKQIKDKEKELLIEKYQWSAVRQNAHMLFPLSYLSPVTTLIGIPPNMQ